MSGLAISLALAVLAGAGFGASPPRAEGGDFGADRLVQWIVDRRGQASIVVSGGPPGSELRWNADTVRPLASTFKTIVLAAYGRAVAEGSLDPDLIVPAAEIERWLIEGTDGGSHVATMERFGTAAGVRLDDLAAAMVVYSSNTAADVLLDRLGRTAIVETAATLGLPSLAAAASPPAGAVALLAAVDLGASTGARLDALEVMDVEAVDAAAWERSADFTAVTDAGPTVEALTELTTWEDQLRLAAVLPWRARPSDVHTLLVRLLIDGRLGDEATRIVAGHMAWPMVDPGLAARFSRLAAKEGQLPGTLVVHGTGRPLAGRAASTDRTVVLSIHDLDYDSWVSLVHAEGHQALALRLIEEPDFVAELGDALGR